MSMEVHSNVKKSVCWVERELNHILLKFGENKRRICWLIDGLVFHRLMRMEVHLRSIMIRTEDL